MKVVHAIAFAGRRSYGLGAVAGNIVAEQRRAGIDASVWCLDTDAEGADALRDYGLEPAAMRRFKATGPRSLGFSLDMERAARAADAAVIDVFHEHGIWTGVSHVVSSWSRRHRHPTVIAPHGAMAPWALRRSAWKKRLARWGYENANFSGAACFHATSALEYRDFREYGLRCPVACIPNGVKDEWLASTGDGARFRAKYGIEPGRRILLFMGRLTPVKNLVRLVEAWAATGTTARDWVLVLAGAAEFGYEVQLDERIRQLGLGDAVRAVGGIHGQDKRDGFAAAECFVLPSLSEGFGMVVLEAIATGIPAIATTGASWEILPKEDCGWWVAPDADGLAGALAAVFASPPERLAGMGRKARALAERDFAWRNVCRQTGSLYEWLRHGGTVPPFVKLD